MSDHQPVRWPTIEPDATPSSDAHQGDHTEPIDYVDTPDRPVHVPPARAPRRWLRRTLLVVAGLLGLLLLLYVVDLLAARGELPRGVTVAGVQVGGLDRASAQETLRVQVEPRLTRPVTINAGDVTTTVDPVAAGLTLDWPATLDQAGDQPLNPWTRLRSMFTTREVGVITGADRAKLSAAVEALRANVDRAPAEGSIRFEGATPIPVDPRTGQALDMPGAVEALLGNWANGMPVQLPVTTTPVRSTPQTVRAALEDVAKPAVSAPVTVTGERGGKASLTPETIAGALSFTVGPAGTLSPAVDNGKLIEALKPQLVPTEQPRKDARVAIEGGRPVVKPSVDGRIVDYDKTLSGLPAVLLRTDERSLAANYVDQPAKFTTEQANQLGIREVIGEFTTRGFAPDSGVNIRTIAAEVNGALIKPGATYSLNNHTGPRGPAQGYIEAGIIERGRPGRAIGGGNSQFATTLYNASYFAGMTDIAHKEHSYYISRYPEAREATVFEGAIDLVFRNDAPTGAMIQTIWTPSSITVKIWGTKHYQVESITGPRSNFTNPPTVTVPHGERCTPGNGSQGFTVSNTRVLRDARTGAELKRTTRTVVYNPVPKIVCEPAPPPGPPAPGP